MNKWKYESRKKSVNNYRYALNMNGNFDRSNNVDEKLYRRTPQVAWRGIFMDMVHLKTGTYSKKCEK